MNSRTGGDRGTFLLDPQDVPVIDVDGPLDEAVAVGRLADHESLSHRHALVGMANVELRPVSQDKPKRLEGGSANFREDLLGSHHHVTSIRDVLPTPY